MAGVGIPKKEAPNEENINYPRRDCDRGSLEYVFASDFIHFVIERYDKGWKRSELLSHRSAITPFNAVIQKAVEEILRNEAFYLEKVFERLILASGELNQIRFCVCAEFLQLHCNGKAFENFHTLLKYFCIVSHFSAWTLGEGFLPAPYICVAVILQCIQQFCAIHDFTSLDDFWYHFEREAIKAIKLPKIALFTIEQLECLHFDIKREERVYKETPSLSSGKEESSENLQVQESKIESSPKNDEAETRALKLSPDKKKIKSYNIGCSGDNPEVRLPAVQEECLVSVPPAEITQEIGEWNWNRESLEYVFASDFIHFVIEREHHGWESHELLTHCSPLTPFNAEIQKAVEGILRKEDIYFELVFKQITQDCGKLDKLRFYMCTVFLKQNLYGTFESCDTLLKYFCLISHFSAWAIKKGFDMAPFLCVRIIIKYITEFRVEHNSTSNDDFWNSLQEEAGDALLLPYINTFEEEQLRDIPDILKQVEGLSI